MDTLKQRPSEFPEFAQYLAAIANEDGRAILGEVLDWVVEQYPELDYRFAWKQPMFTHHGTFIIGFSAASKHFSVAGESAGLQAVKPMLDEGGYTYGAKLFRVRYDQPVPFAILRAVIELQLREKSEVTSFWRPAKR